jgi:hypothetical protein
MGMMDGIPRASRPMYNPGSFWLDSKKPNGPNNFILHVYITWTTLELLPLLFLPLYCIYKSLHFLIISVILNGSVPSLTRVSMTIISLRMDDNS